MLPIIYENLKIFDGNFVKQQNYAVGTPRVANPANQGTLFLHQSAIGIAVWRIQNFHKKTQVSLRA